MADHRTMLRFSDPGRAALPARYEGKLVLVTGANLGGIGGAVAQRLAAEGARLALFSQSPLEPLLETLSPYAERIFAASGDVRRQAEVDGFVQEATRRFGPIHGLVNNAGVAAAGRFEQISDEQWSELLDVNLGGVMRMTRAMLPHAAGRACIVNVASALALAGSASFAAYSASKGGVIALTRALAAELAPRGVRVVAVAPGLVRTPLVERHLENITPAAVAQVRAAQPLGIGKPEDVAAAVAFLASDEARWITGAILPLGWSPSLDLPMCEKPIEDEPNEDEASEDETFQLRVAA